MLCFMSDTWWRLSDNMASFVLGWIFLTYNICIQTFLEPLKLGLVDNSALKKIRPHAFALEEKNQIA